MTGQDTGDEKVERVAGWWVLCAVLGPFGFGTPAGFAYAAHRSGTRRWYAWAAIWGALTTIGIVLAALAPREGAQFMLGALMIYGTWLGGAAHALVVRPDYVRKVAARGTDPLGPARERLAQRARARQLALEQPDLAREIGLGRPDLPGAHAMDVVDVNHAPVEALAELPGIDAELAGRLVAAREEVKGFVSVEDAGVVLDLDTTTVDRLSRQAVFLPF